MWLANRLSLTRIPIQYILQRLFDQDPNERFHIARSFLSGMTCRTAVCFFSRMMALNPPTRVSLASTDMVDYIIMFESTFRNMRPWEIFSASKKPPFKWQMGPASPQCGRSTNVFSPCSLESHHHPALLQTALKVRIKRYDKVMGNLTGRAHICACLPGRALYCTEESLAARI